MSELLPLDRRRAAHALGRIECFRKGASPELREAYRSYVQGVAALIVTTGLGQTLALLLSQGGKAPEAGRGGKAPAAWTLIFEHLADWLVDKDPAQLFGEAAKTADRAGRLGLLLQLSQPDWLVAQAEALSYLDWLKKFANALLAEPGKHDEGRS